MTSTIYVRPINYSTLHILVWYSNLISRFNRTRYSTNYMCTSCEHRKFIRLWINNERVDTIYLSSINQTEKKTSTRNHTEFLCAVNALNFRVYSRRKGSSFTIQWALHERPRSPRYIIKRARATKAAAAAAPIRLIAIKINSPRGGGCSRRYNAYNPARV